MSRGIRIYIEGGGDSRTGKALLRSGYSQFLIRIRDIARKKSIHWDIILCGSRNSAFDDFRAALVSHPESYCILLVDSEDPVLKSPWMHLKDRDAWINPGAEDNQCQLMVQMMEAWLIADRKALEDFFGKEFNANPIPDTMNVEDVGKTQLESALKEATRRTQKGEYHKIHHGAKILAKLDSINVRERAPHCERMFVTLNKLLDDLT